MTDLYTFAGSNETGLTTCVPIQKDKKFGGAFCADIAPMGNLSNQYNLPENESAHFMIYSEKEQNNTKSLE